MIEIPKITVVCFLWNESRGRKNKLFLYDSKYVNTMKSMIDRNLKHKHDMVCVTDMPDGIDPDIRIVPLPRDLLKPRSRFPKLMIFHPNAKELFGEVIWSFDLDTVIVNQLDSLLEKLHGRDIVCWQNPNWGLPKRTQYNSSTVLLRAGTKSHIWNKYKSGIEERDDQDWMTKNLTTHEAVWTKEDGIYWSPHLIAGLPKNAKVVTFAGQHGPSLLEEQRLHPWITNYWW